MMYPNRLSVEPGHLRNTGQQLASLLAIPTGRNSRFVARNLRHVALQYHRYLILYLIIRLRFRTRHLNYSSWVVASRDRSYPTDAYSPVEAHELILIGLQKAHDMRNEVPQMR